tara:strand:+ start:56 stop:574 length:519 start_codon:yes stop_codon:yes gene_type:complete
MAIRNKTYNNVIDTIKCVAEKHYQINKVTTGDIWELDLDKNEKYPLLHITPSTVTAEVNQLLFDFQLVLGDLVEPDGSNEQEVLSNCLSILLDLVSVFRRGKLLGLSSEVNAEYTQNRYITELPYSFEPFTEDIGNNLTGWITTMRIIVEFDYNACADEIPIDQSVAGGCIK